MAATKRITTFIRCVPIISAQVQSNTLAAEYEWRKSWKPDIRACPWQPLDVDGRMYLVKCRFTDDTYEMMLTDLKTVWVERLGKEALEKRIKMLNPSLKVWQMDLVLGHIRCSLLVPNASSDLKFTIPFTASEEEEEGGRSMTLRMTSRLAGQSFAWQFYGEHLDEDKVAENLTYPLMTMVGELLRRQKELMEIIRNKDKEIAYYKSLGMQASRSGFQTFTFFEAEFKYKMETSLGFEGLVKKQGMCAFTEQAQSLYKDIMTKHAWLNRFSNKAGDGKDSLSSQTNRKLPLSQNSKRSSTTQTPTSENMSGKGPNKPKLGKRKSKPGDVGADSVSGEAAVNPPAPSSAGSSQGKKALTPCRTPASVNTVKPAGSKTQAKKDKSINRPSAGKKKGQKKDHRAKRRIVAMTLANDITMSHYRRAYYGLYKISDSSKTHFQALVKTLIRKEVKSLYPLDLSLGKLLTLENLDKFSFENALKQLKESAPLLMEVLIATITKKKNEQSLQRGENRPVDLKIVLCTAVACLLRARIPTKFTFIQTLLSIEFWQAGVKQDILNQLSKTGTCMGYAGVLNAIDQIRKCLDHSAKQCKEKLQLQLNTTDSQVESDMEANADDTDGAASETPTEPQPGYTLCWDNVGKKVITRYLTRDSKGLQSPKVAIAYMAVNRVPSSHLKTSNDSIVPALDIPNEAFVASEDDFGEVLNRMKVIVGRIIMRHIPWFQDYFSDCVVKHLMHEHSEELAQPSALYNLGCFDDEPNSTENAIKIYKRLQEYIPKVGGQPYQTIVFGDGISCEMGNDAIEARRKELNPWERLEGLEPAAQESHKEMLLLQDHFDEFYKVSSKTEKGTLYNLKSLFNFRSVYKADIGDSVPQAWELTELTTEALITLLAMSKMGMKNRDDSPENQGVTAESFEERKDFFERVCEDIVNTLWHDVNTNVLKIQSDEDNGEAFCCDEDKDEGLIGCESRHGCLHGRWFHHSCASVDPDNIPDEWFCSEQCQANHLTAVTYCYCRRDLEESSMVGCAAKSKCTCKEWYHMECVGFTAGTVPQGDWYCSKACRDLFAPKRSAAKRQKLAVREVPSQDHKFLYTIAMAWSGLNLLCRRDAVREGDGNAMMSHWLIDLLQFYSNGHVKFVTLAHRLIASINGWLPENLRHDLKWNRTVNYSGGIGRNLPIDISNDVLSPIFKNMFRADSVHRGFTPLTLARCSQLIGPFRERSVVLFETDKQMVQGRERSVNTDANVAKVVEYLKQENLFTVTPGRQYKSFPDFLHEVNPACPEKYLAKIKELSSKLDMKRR